MLDLGSPSGLQDRKLSELEPGVIKICEASGSVYSCPPAFGTLLLVSEMVIGRFRQPCCTTATMLSSHSLDSGKCAPPRTALSESGPW